jgi:hypothetical protein
MKKIQIVMLLIMVVVCGNRAGDGHNYKTLHLIAEHGAHCC